MPPLKVTVKGEVFPFDNERYTISEAIALEENLGMPFREWRYLALPSGSTKALAAFIWLVLKRNGQDVAWEDIVSGAYDLTENDVEFEQEGGEDPTGAPSPAGDGSTSEPSPSDSGSGPGSGTDSPSPKSTS
jgi:hypothetical protein